MSKLTSGQFMPDFSFETPFETGRSLGEIVKKAPKTALVFLRYYGCTLCQYDIQQFAAHYEEISAHGGQLLVALQSDPKKLAGQLSSEALPFDIICDPEQKLYEQFEIVPASAPEQLIDKSDEKALEKFSKVKASGLQHGDYEGNELQLPAVFVVTPDLKLTYAHYGKTATDVPTPQELAALLK